MRITLLDSFPADQGDPQAWLELARFGELVAHPRTAAAQRADRCRDAEAVITNKVVLDRDLLGALPALRYIGVSATGTNVVNLEAATTRGIAVTNVPGYSTESVAQLVFAHLLHFAFDVAGHDAAVKSGRWAASADFAFFLRPLRELAGKVLVVVGLGAIGSAVARIARAFGMEVVTAAVPGSPNVGAAGRVPLEQALPRADFVTLHCPLAKATQGLVNADFLGRLRPGTVLVNTSRGGLLDDQAVAQALASGQLGGLAADVLTSEPPPAAHPLTDPRAPYADRVVITPHIAWGTVEARTRLRHEVAENVAAFQRGERRNRIV